MVTMTDDKLEGEGRNVIKHSARIFLQMLKKYQKTSVDIAGVPAGILTWYFWIMSVQR